MSDGGISTGSHQHLGSIYRSLEYLPRYFQIFALFGAFFLASIRENPVIAWLAVTMHSSFGTEIVWSVEYQRRLELMTLNERLCLTLYGVALSALAMFTYVKTGHDVLYHLVQESGVDSNSRRWPVAIMCLMLACEGMVILKEEAACELSSSDSIAHFVLTGFRGFEQTGFDPRLKYANPHFLIQVQILKAYAMSFVKRMLPAVILAFVYRSGRDARRSAHAALRWYTMTIMIFRSLCEAYTMMYGDGLRQYSSWSLLLTSVVWYAMVNYTFGPSKRAGWTASTSSASSVRETTNGISKCIVLFFMVYLSVLALVVSVHVVELLLIWLMFFLLTVWIPAIIDSCAVSYIICITTAVSFVVYKMNHTTKWGSLRLIPLFSLWWLDICILYSLVANVTHSRFGGTLAVLVALGFHCYHSLEDLEHGVRTSGSYVEKVVTMLREVVEETVTMDEEVSAGPRTEKACYKTLVVVACAVMGFLISVAALLEYSQSSDVRVHLLNQNIILVTPRVLFRKFVRTFILVISLLVFVIAGLVMYRLVPQLAMFVPDFIALGVAVGVACAILGRLIDLQDPLYDALMRLIGAMEPPALTEDSVLDEGYGRWKHA
ncbi:hypothetical protein DPX39_040017600 [Trypanosoma brucei equiperdum]|uniref:Transmembrane protein n=1 Tax=Trypanosoma brucei equiperdum TaxID=630700 RepID=A0A3L6L9T4_9TRYP|nr:hypothetical protein DPX39_040017600 [Trypanosoma brucei equiperdum]